MKNKKRVIFFTLSVLLIIILIYFIFFNNKVSVRRQIINETQNYTVEELIFSSWGQEIYSLLFLPKSTGLADEKHPLVIVLPGAEGTKESRSFYADIVYEGGYATLILDQRGIGETNAMVNSLQQDFNEFSSGNKEGVIQYIMAQDVLSAVDAVEKIKEINRGKIVVLGESMGGRFAILSAALDKRIKAAIVISSAGYNFKTGNPLQDDFIDYINPNSYISRISPRHLLMLHAENDSVIPIQDARYTYSLALEPKKFVALNDPICSHGYCPKMHDPIMELLETISF